jgi:hypothetical protein
MPPQKTNSTTNPVPQPGFRTATTLGATAPPGSLRRLPAAQEYSRTALCHCALPLLSALVMRPAEPGHTPSALFRCSCHHPRRYRASSPLRHLPAAQDSGTALYHRYSGPAAQPPLSCTARRYPCPRLSQFLHAANPAPRGGLCCLRPPAGGEPVGVADRSVIPCTLTPINPLQIIAHQHNPSRTPNLALAPPP